MRLRLIGVLASLLMIAPVASFARTPTPTAQGTTKTLAPYAASANSKEANSNKDKRAKKAKPPKKNKKKAKPKNK